MVTKKLKKTGVGNIPIDWQCRKIGDVAKVCMCKRIFTEQTSETEEIPFYKIGTFGKKADAYISRELYEEYKQRFSFPNVGDVLISAAGTLGRVVVFDGKDSYFQDSNIVWLDINKNMITNQYLYHYYKIIKWASSEGSTIARLYNGIIYDTDIAFPDVKEQKIIAEKLSDIDNLISTLEKQITKKKLIKQGVMQELLSGKRRLSGFAGKWTKIRFGDCCTIFRGGSPRPISDYLSDNPNDVHWIKIGDVSESDKYITSTAEFIYKSGVSRSREVYAGDFILSNSMSFGRPYILQINGCIHDGWLVIQNYQNFFDQQYLYYALSSDDTKAQYFSMAAGSSVQNLNKEKVANLKLYMPSIKEQEAISDILSDMDTEIVELEKKLGKFIQIKRGMMEQLLTGKIRLV